MTCPPPLRQVDSIEIDERATPMEIRRGVVVDAGCDLSTLDLKRKGTSNGLKNIDQYGRNDGFKSIVTIQ